MKHFTNRTWAQIDLDAIAHNIQEIKKCTSPKAKIMAIVKADAYGHGYLEVSRTLLSAGASVLGVAFIDEAEQLRRHGITADILLLGYTPRSQLHRLVDLDIIPAIYSYEDALILSQIAEKKGKDVRVHIKIDTGMNRIGLMSEKPESIDEAERIYRLSHIRVEGIFSHLSKADEEDDTYSYEQFDRFNRFVAKLEKRGVHIPIRHICNSAGILKYPQMHMDMVRAGICMYGYFPSAQVAHSCDLRPAMSVKSIITRVEEIPEGARVSYNGKFIAPHKMKIATVPIGYADGYFRNLSGRAKMLVRGQFADVVGTICMDQCMIDVTNVNNIDVEEEVTIIGRDGENVISAEEMGTISYEVLCVIGKRVPRVYMKDGQIIDVLNYLI